MRPLLSIIIPYHNSAATIGRLLASIAHSKKAPAYEVIVVDDGSTQPVIPGLTRDPSSQKTGFRLGGRNDKMHLRTVRLKTNRGPAVARNRGVAAAKGKFVVFLDSDVELFPDTLHNLAKVFLDDPDVVALTGVWVKEQRTKDFFPNFKALRDWSYWINERDKSGYYFLFSTRIASIKKAVFQRLGGFDETYPAPLVEDIELTYRIARRYAIIFAHNVRVRHEFESFWPIAKKYFLRAFYWTRLYQRRKKFDPVATTWQEAATTLSGVAVVFFSFVSVSLLSLIGQVGLFCALLLHLFLIRRFLVFMYREKGLWFAIRGFFVGLILYCFIFAGALAGRLRLGR
ncbi:glycosyltransferase family 2 protein [Candidatus Gottesmanbacteria bacterium]|nr:glycosyltransferase family 2 protein [Candidatus Gottesmanbacteria bacterium]